MGECSNCPSGQCFPSDGGGASTKQGCLTEALLSLFRLGPTPLNSLTVPGLAGTKRIYPVACLKCEPTGTLLPTHPEGMRRGAETTCPTLAKLEQGMQSEQLGAGEPEFCVSNPLLLEAELDLNISVGCTKGRPTFEGGRALKEMLQGLRAGPSPTHIS